MSEDDERQGGQDFDKVKAGLTEDIVHLIAEQLIDRADRELAPHASWTALTRVSASRSSRARRRWSSPSGSTSIKAMQT